MGDLPKPNLSVDLSDQVAIVTGASRGLGAAIAFALGVNGATVACIDMVDCDETVAAITEAGGKAEFYKADVTDRQTVEDAIDAITDKHDRLDILINNAGIRKDTLLPRMTDEQWDDVINVNLRGVFLFTRAASRHMLRARSGRIITVSSIAGIIGNAGQTNYSATKAAVIGMSRSLSRELAGRNVTINCVAPGFIESDMTKTLGDAILDEAKKRIPAKRLGKAGDIADGVLFLASKAASYITGQVLIIDGGMTG